MSQLALAHKALPTLPVLKAPRAPPGPQGPAGPSGPVGPAGPKGEPGAAAAAATEPFGAQYVGAATCGACHQELYDVFVKSGHPYKLNKVVDGKAPTYPFSTIPEPPKSYTWNDISYVIGGYGWKARFMNKEGYIITDWITSTATISDTNFVGQYNFANPIVGKDAGWVKYNAGRENMKYDCGPCHMTAYSKQGNQDGLPGIVGTWAEPGIQCEECHGPGSLHVANPRGVALEIERDSELCGKCHIRGPIEVVEAKDGFIEHHEQYEELFQSKHITINCVTRAMIPIRASCRHARLATRRCAWSARTATSRRRSLPKCRTRRWAWPALIATCRASPRPRGAMRPSSPGTSAPT